MSDTVRQYLTYIPQYVRNSDFPGGAYVDPRAYFELNFGPTETLNTDEHFSRHYNGQDCRTLAWVDGPDDHLSTGSTITVAQMAADQGLRSFCSQTLTIEEALEIAKAFSPARENTFPNWMPGGGDITVTYSECRIEAGAIVQDRTSVVASVEG
jgi:hypothetical protein